jgi:homotetrameric cytidine deaminase
MKVSKSVETALKAAIKTRQNAHAPYSRFKVGAALQIKGEKEPITGCNVENASFGATICAERAAILRAIADHGRIKPEFIVVATHEENATVPCANCLQVMVEFCADDMPVYLGNEEGVQKSYFLRDLLPHPFRAFKGE